MKLPKVSLKLKESVVKDPALFLGIVFLLLFSLVILRSVASQLFPVYFAYILIGCIAFYLLTRISFDVLSLFSWHFYFVALGLLILTLILGQVTRGAVRWIPIGKLTFQPAEIVRPFLLVFFANFLASEKLSFRRLMAALGLLVVPLILILLQPSLGVSLLTVIGFVGILLAADMNKRALLTAILVFLVISPVSWFLLAPYQKQRVLTFLAPQKDPAGAGYSSIQAMISVGSGKISGRGLGEGVQTQLLFLPERQSDFIFAAVAEEMGFVGASILILGLAFLLFRIIKTMEEAVNPTSRAFMAGVFLTLFCQILIHVGMNMGLLPITGIPLPLISAGGSSLVATLLMLGMVIGAKK